MSDTASEREEDRADREMGASPARISSPELRFEAARAFVWLSIIGLVALAIYISKSLLVIFGACVFAAMVDGGSRLLCRIAPIGRGWRLAIVLIGATAFLVWLAIFAGSQISQQAAEFPDIVNRQIGATIAWLREQGFAISSGDIQNLASQMASGAGAISSMVGGLFGGLTTLLLIVIIGIYLAVDPRLYERGVRWLVPSTQRKDTRTMFDRMAFTMRRLMAGRLVGMAFEGVFTYVMLLAYGLVTGDMIPMAALLAILTGLLAFVPNIGAIVSGVLMVLVGFSGGAQMGIYTIVVYFLVQNIDGYIIVPMIAKKTVDLAPALVLGFQLIMGILFGILGLFLADPLLAMIKVALEQRAEAKNREDGGELDEAARNAPQAMTMEENPA